MLDELKLHALDVWRTRYLARAVLVSVIPVNEIGLQVPVARSRTPIVRVRNRHGD